MKRHLMFFASAALIAGALLAADKPNFSGTWKQNIEKSSTSSGSTLQSYINKVEQNGDTLKVITTTVGSRGERTYERTYTIGKQENFKAPDGDPVTSIVNWEGDRLVFQTTTKEEDGSTVEMREVWSLSNDGKTLTKARSTKGPQGNREQTYVLDRQ